MCDACEVHVAIYPGGYRGWERDHPGEPFPETGAVVGPPADVPAFEPLPDAEASPKATPESSTPTLEASDTETSPTA